MTKPVRVLPRPLLKGKQLLSGERLIIKPYLPSIDGVKSTKNELIEKEPGLPCTKK
jgi:hypothetical protein